MKRTLLSAAVLLTSIVGLTAQNNADNEKLNAIIEEAKITFVKNQQSDKRIPNKLLAEAEAVLIGSIGQGALIFGGGSGQAIAMKNNIDNWSPPAFYDFSEGSFGLQFTAKETHVIALFMNKKAALQLYKDEFNWGVGAVVEVGPNGGQLALNTWQDADILVYATTDGLDVGFSLGGGTLSFDKEANQAEYGQETASSQHMKRTITPEIILGSAVEMPKAAVALSELLSDVSFKQLAPPVAMPKAVDANAPPKAKK